MFSHKSFKGGFSVKRFGTGFVAGFLVCTLLTVGVSFAEDLPIRLVVNGQEIFFPEAPPQIINGYTMVPARPLAEALGAQVAWDEATRTVIVAQYEEPAPPLIEEPPLTLTVDGVVYYERVRLLQLLQAKYPEVRVGTQSGDVVIGFTKYESHVQNWKQRRSYLDVTSLLEAGVLTQEELDEAYRM